MIIAEGAAAETFVDCDSRAMFANAAEFAQLYPNDTVKKWEDCARRVEDGEALADIRRRLNLRAGIDDGDWRGGHVPGDLRGNLEVVSEQMIRGWAQDVSAPERPVWLEVLDNGEPIARVLANAYRTDLERAGLGSGRHAFSLLAPRLAAAHRVEVRRAADCRPLPGSPAG